MGEKTKILFKVFILIIIVFEIFVHGSSVILMMCNVLMIFLNLSYFTLRINSLSKLHTCKILKKYFSIKTLLCNLLQTVRPSRYFCFFSTKLFQNQIILLCISLIRLSAFSSFCDDL